MDTPIAQTQHGIAALFAKNPKTALPMQMLAEALLRGDDSELTMGEREFLAAVVSATNGTEFCTKSHMAFALEHRTNGNGQFLDESLPIILGPDALNVRLYIPTAKIELLSVLAIHVVLGTEKETVDEYVTNILNEGITPGQVQETIAIAAAFCMYNKYVTYSDGATLPENDEYYYAAAKWVANTGYIKKTQ